MNKKTITVASKDTIIKLKVLAKKKEGIRRKLVVTAGARRLKAKKLAVTAKEKESVRHRLVVTAKQLAATAKEKERVRSRLVVTAKQLAVTAKEKESVRSKLVVTAKKLAATAKEKERVRSRLVVTAEKLAVTAKEKESVRHRLVVTAKQLAVTAKEKESVRSKLVVTAEKLAATAKEKERVRSRLVVTAKQLAVVAKEKESVRRKLAVTAEEIRLHHKQLAIIAKEKESVRSKLVVTAEKLAVTAKEKESVRHRLVVTAKQLAATAKEKERVRSRLVVTAKQLAATAKEKESVRSKLVVTAKDLARAKARDEATLASIGDGLVTTDKEEKIILVNSAFEEMLGWNKSEVKGKKLSEMVTMTDQFGKEIPESERLLTKTLKQGISTTTTTNTETTTYKRKNGTIFPVAVTVAPIVVGSELIGAVEVFRDITKEKEIDRAKSEFVSLASHQLRTPPTSMKWFLEMLLSGEVGLLNEKQKEYFEEVYRNNQRMITLVNTLLDVSRIELGVLAIEPEPTDVIVLTKGIIEELNPQIHKKEILMKEKYSKNLQVVSVDPKLLRIAIQNIISNAVKYTSPKGTISVEIFLKRSSESIGGRTIQKDSLIIVVSDTGYGIPKDQQDRIFTKLFRADNVKEKDTDGTGLGLYLAKSIINHAHGDIWFESELNKGTIFYLAIPLEGMKKIEGTAKLTMVTPG